MVSLPHVNILQQKGHQSNVPVSATPPLWYRLAFFTRFNVWSSFFFGSLIPMSLMVVYGFLSMDKKLSIFLENPYSLREDGQKNRRPPSITYTGQSFSKISHKDVWCLGGMKLPLQSLSAQVKGPVRPILKPVVLPTSISPQQKRNSKEKFLRNCRH